MTTFHRQGLPSSNLRVERHAFETSRAYAVEDESLRAQRRKTLVQPAITVVIINYNGRAWLERCLSSLRAQTIFEQLEVIVADNASPDQSGRQATQLMRDWPLASVLQYKTNFGYASGNNQAAHLARGHYLLFLNNDTWLEPDCLENLLKGVKETDASAATPLVMDYADNRIQSVGELGFDIFGLVSGTTKKLSLDKAREVFVATGPAVLIKRELFHRVGGFDDQFFMYAEEYDLCWKIWLAGHKVIFMPSARLHHRGAVNVNPSGHDKVLENRTSDSKRFYANRNNLLVLLKNCQHFLLLLVLMQLLLLATEAVVMGIFVRRWRFVRTAYIETFVDCWRLRRHILAERRRIKTFRKCGDFRIVRFLRLPLNRWRELENFQRFGAPKIDPK